MCMQAGFAFLPIFHSLAHCIPLEFTNIKRFMVSPIALIFFYGSDQLKVALIVQNRIRTLEYECLSVLCFAFVI